MSRQYYQYTSSYRRAVGARAALGRARIFAADFAARTVRVGFASRHAEAGVRVARARPVALQNRPGTSADQRVPVEPGRAATLHAVVDDLALGARSASRRAVARV